MKSLIKGFILLITVISILAIVYLIFLYPNHKYVSNNTPADTVDVRALIMKSMPKKFSLENKELTTNISLSAEDLRNLIVSNLKKNDSFQAADVIISNNYMNIFISQKALKYIPYEISLAFKSEIKEEHVRLVLENSKLGRLELDKEKVLNKIRDSKAPFFDVRPLAGEIILEDSELKDIITVSEVKLQDQKLTAELQIEFHSLEDFMKVLNILANK